MLPESRHETVGADPLDFASRLARPARLQFLANIGRAVLLFAYQLLVARLFGAALFGITSLAIAAAQVVGMLSHLGGDYAILRGSDRRTLITDDSSRTFRFALLPSLVAGVAAAACLVVLASLTEFLGTDRRLPIAIAIVAPTVIAFGTTSLIAALLQASNRLHHYSLVQTFLEPAARLVSFTVLLATLGQLWSVPLWSYSLAMFVTLFVGVFLGRNELRVPIKSDDWREGAKGLVYSVPVMLSFLLQFATLFVNLAILTRMDSADTAGVYSGAMRIAMLALWAQMAFSAPFLPLIARALDTDRASLNLTYQRMVRFVLIVNAPLLVMLFVGRDPIMELFGPEFSLGSTALGWMLFGQLVNTGTAAIEAILPLGGNARIGVINNVLQLTMNVALAVLLIPAYGVSGAGFATGVSVVLINVLRAYQVWRRWSITPLSAGLWAIVGTLILTVAGWELLVRRGSIQSLEVSVLGAFVSAVVVLLVAVRLVTPEDRTILWGLLRITSPRRKTESSPAPPREPM